MSAEERVEKRTQFWTEPRCARHGWWLLLLLTAMLYLPGTGTLPLMDRDEPRFAQATVEMMQRGTWSVPYFNGEYRFDKPPLTYWWIQLHDALLGITELSARLHSVAATYLTALIVCGMAGRISNSRRDGLVAGLLWLTSLQVLIHGRLCVADMPMVLCVTLACRALLELVVLAKTKPPALWWWAFWLALGLGFLAKGPIAWLVPGLTLVLWRFVLWRKPAAWQHLGLLPGLALMMAPVAAWGIPALIETQGLFWQVGMGRHVVQRGVEVLNGRKFIPGFYLITTWLSLFPWLFFVMPVWRMLRHEWTSERAFLVACFLVPQGVFFFYATQLPHYVMPGYPAFIVLLALAWRGNASNATKPLPKLALYGVSTLSGLMITAAVMVWMTSIANPDLRDLIRSASSLLVAVFGLGGCSALCAWRGRAPSCWAAPLAASLALTVSLTSFSQNLRETSVTLRAAKPLNALPSDARMLASGYDEPSLVFYTQKRWQMGAGLPLLRQQLALPGPCAVVLLRREWTLDHWFKSQMGHKPPASVAKDRSTEVDALRAEFPDMETHVIEGFNGARSSWTEAVVLVRRR